MKTCISVSVNRQDLNLVYRSLKQSRRTPADSRFNIHTGNRKRPSNSFWLECFRREMIGHILKNPRTAAHLVVFLSCVYDINMLNLARFCCIADDKTDGILSYKEECDIEAFTKVRSDTRNYSSFAAFLITIAKVWPFFTEVYGPGLQVPADVNSWQTLEVLRDDEPEMVHITLGTGWEVPND